MKLKEQAKQLKSDIPAVYLALKHKETPLLAKVLAAFVVVYALSPIDLIPDFIPVLGYLDDIILLPGLIALIIKLIPGEIFEECRQEAADLWLAGKPKVWYYALPIVFFWLITIYFIVKAIWQ